MKSLISKLTNTKTLCALVSLIIVVVNEFYEIDTVWVKYVTETIAALLITLGVINKDGMNTTKWDK